MSGKGQVARLAKKLVDEGEQVEDALQAESPGQLGTEMRAIEDGAATGAALEGTGWVPSPDAMAEIELDTAGGRTTDSAGGESLDFPASAFLGLAVTGRRLLVIPMKVGLGTKVRDKSFEPVSVPFDRINVIATDKHMLTRTITLGLDDDLVTLEVAKAAFHQSFLDCLGEHAGVDVREGPIVSDADG